MNDQKSLRPGHRGGDGPRNLEQLGGRLEISNTAFPASAQPRRRARSIICLPPGGQGRCALSPISPQVHRHRRISRHTIAAWLSGAERQRLALPADSPRRRPSLPQLKFMREVAQ
jgi:hypothetical protein